MRPAARAAAGESVAQMVRLALLESFGRQARPTRHAAMQERIRGYVLRHLNDPELSLERIAAALRCSKRTLHESFKGTGQTLAAYIQAQRIEACARDLRDPALAHLSVGEIALTRGFVNLSHFSKRFQAQLGMSPRAWRAESAAGLPR
jgi:AraC-like DNA-binding protein